MCALTAALLLAERAALIGGVAEQARPLVCKTRGKAEGGRGRRVLKELPQNDAEDVRGLLRELMSEEAGAARAPVA